MQKILRKRIFRELKENVFRYLALGLLVVLGMYIVTGLVGAAETIIRGTAEAAEQNCIEDGQFSVFVPLTEKEKTSLEADGITIEEHFYLDYELADSSILRIFSPREKTDLVQADSGRLPKESGEILLERRYCEEHSILAGDKIKIGSLIFTVTGSGTVPDYELPVQNFSDSSADSSRFGFGFVTADAYQQMKNSGGSISSEEYFYAFLLNGRMTDKQLKEKLQDLEISADNRKDETFQFLDHQSDDSVSKMTAFVSAADNPRIGSAADDEHIHKTTGLAAGVIVLILFSYVISVFTVHSIERESGVIGTLYAMGVKKRELLRHYLTLPVLLTFLAGVTGTVMGYSSFGVRVQMTGPYSYFSMPDLDVVYQPYLFMYGIVMPPLTAAFTNYFVIRKKLDRPALALIRGEQKKNRVQNIQLKGGFVCVFRIRQLLREKRTAVTVFFGMFISLLVVMLSLDCFAICSHIKTENVKDTKFEYMYTYKYPDAKLPDGGEEAYGVTMKKETLGYRFDVTLLGIHKSNPYFDAPVEKGENRVLVSSAMAQKYGIHSGDILTLSDEENDRYYAFRVDGTVTYSAGFFVFMDIESMRGLMGARSDFYNIVFADRALEIDSSRLYSTLSKGGVEKSSAVFVEMMKNMVTMLLAVSVLMFTVVMYLMMKVMADRSAMPISLFQVFGYKKKEIKKLFLDGNFFVVVLSALFGIPLSKIMMDRIFPYMVSNVACGINIAFSWQMYAGIFLGVLMLYVIISRILMLRVNKILPAEVLKNRE